MSLPINKYLRDRHNAEPSIESKKTNPTEAKKETALPKEEKKTEPSRFETSEKKELSWVEKLKPKTQEPLLGGVCKNTDYAGSISEKDLDKVSQNYPAYKEAEVTTGVDW
ncbi:MAG: hypothetical protein JNK65_06275, partial [Deltaproteobacteria bacterium]|nr:hypothetical protein [Deltaproteobacteria bacterium]